MNTISTRGQRQLITSRMMRKWKEVDALARSNQCSVSLCSRCLRFVSLFFVTSRGRRRESNRAFRLFPDLEAGRILETTTTNHFSLEARNEATFVFICCCPREREIFYWPIWQFISGDFSLILVPWRKKGANLWVGGWSAGTKGDVHPKTIFRQGH